MVWSSRQTLSWNAVPIGFTGTENSCRWPYDNIGYDARSVADIHNNMVDDVKVILAEYRLALKKYNADRKI